MKVDKNSERKLGKKEKRSSEIYIKKKHGTFFKMVKY